MLARKLNTTFELCAQIRPCIPPSSLSPVAIAARWRNFCARFQMPSFYIKTYGCQMNERDSEAVAAQLVAKGYSLAPSEHAADVILLNTCSVRDMAERKAVGKMA